MAKNLKELGQKIHTADAAIHASLVTKFPRLLPRIDKVLDATYSILSHSLFSLLIAGILFLLALASGTKTVTAVAFAIWFVACVWTSCAARDLSVLGRLVLFLVVAVVYGVSARGFEHWVFRQMQQPTTTAPNVSQQQQRKTEVSGTPIASGTLEPKTGPSTAVKIRSA